MIEKRFRRTLVPLAGAAAAVALASCATHRPVPSRPSTPHLEESSYTSFDGDRLPYQRWMPDGDTKLVVIGFHGIAGASADLHNLGEHLQAHLPGTAVYAPDLRGQGNDPQVARRGDIGHREDWLRDARTFSRLVKREHPGAPIIWCGESMGSLIALHATATTTPSPCDGLILASPVVRIGDNIPAWRLAVLRLAAAIAPGKRISLESLSGEDAVQVTRGEVHQEQTATNPYHVSRFSLRLLASLEHLIRTAPRAAGEVDVPVLVVHGGKDIFSTPADIEKFAGDFPTPADRRFYTESYHLLFYDHEKDQVIADVTAWLKALPTPRP